MKKFVTMITALLTLSICTGLFAVVEESKDATEKVDCKDCKVSDDNTPKTVAKLEKLIAEKKVALEKAVDKDKDAIEKDIKELQERLLNLKEWEKSNKDGKDNKEVKEVTD